MIRARVLQLPCQSALAMNVSVRRAPAWSAVNDGSSHSCSDRNRSASSAAMHPIPAEVTA